MELRHLRYFVVVAEEGHVTRAAERLAMQQPPLSQQIRALEEELDVRLFVRKPRGVELTTAGAAFLAQARAILAAADAAIETARRAARGEEGRVAVGFTSSTPFHPFITAALRRFREQFPLVALTLEEGGTGDLSGALSRGHLDAAFVRSPVDESEGFALHHVLDEPMLLALPPEHHLARRRRRPRLSELSNEPFVLYRRASGPGLHDAITAACQLAGFSPRIEQEAPRIVATLNLVSAGLGVTLVPESLSHMQRHQVTYRRLNADPPLVAPIWLAHRTDLENPAGQRFVDLVRSPAGKRGDA